MTTMTAAQIAELHFCRTLKGVGYAPSLAECLDAARTGRLFDVDTRSDGEDGLTIANDATSALAGWAAAASPDDTAVPEGWTATAVALAAEDCEAIDRSIAIATAGAARVIATGDGGAVYGARGIGAEWEVLVRSAWTDRTDWYSWREVEAASPVDAM